MKASWEKIEKNLGVLEVEVDADQVAVALDKAFKKIVKQINVPGFRKGKVPRHIFEAKYGVESLYQDAIDILLPYAYLAAVNETGIEPVDRPEVDIDQFGKGQPFKFKARVTVKPEVQLGEYKGIEVPAQDDTVTDEEIEAELKRMQERHAELVIVDEGPAQAGDIVSIDFEGSIDGEPFEGGKAERYSLELGSGSFIPGFEDQVIGMNIAEDKDVNVTFPEDYHAAELAGKAAVFKVKLHEIKRKNLPELDDEFAKDVSEFETLEEYKADVAKRLQERKIKEYEQLREKTVIEKAAEAAEVDIPPVMIDNEVDRMLRDFSNRLRMQGMTLELYYQFSGQDEAALKEQMRADAEKRVLNSLVLEKIAEVENLTVTEEEVNEELADLAKLYNKTPEETRSMLESSGNLEALKEDLLIRKAVRFLVDASKTASQVA
jgi:trigger factor